MPTVVDLVMLDGPDPNTQASLSTYFSIDPISAALIQRTYTEEDIRRIALLLAAIEDGIWSRTPRLYTVLRRAGLLSLQNDFASLQLTDASFPFSAANLPQTLDPSQRSTFLQHQPCIMTESSSLGDCEQGKHCTYQRPDQVPFQNKGILGSGGFAEVQRVASTITHRTYARKLFHRKKFGRFKDNLLDFENELDILKQMRHEHIVEIVGSYTDPRYMALIMSPVADYDLSRFLKLAPKSMDGLSSLKTFFGCLATATQYLHKNRIRHKDIKPSNVLVKDGNVLLTDFGLSRDCNHTRSTTEGPTARTAKYCAPEVADYMPRSYSSDMWSLGCVFLEVMTVLKGFTVEDLSGFLAENGSHALPFSMNLEAVKAWMEKLEHSQEMERENGPLGWIEQLLCEDRGLRPTAYDLISDIVNYRSMNDRVGEFCGICCRIEDDAGSMMSEGLFVGKDEDGDGVVVKTSVEDEMGLWIDDPMVMTLPEVPDSRSETNVEAEDDDAPAGIQIAGAVGLGQTTAETRYFIMRSNSQLDIETSSAHSTWISNPKVNTSLDNAFKTGKRIMLFFSVVKSRRFCGAAEMTSAVDREHTDPHWETDRWQG
ncbi:kinase-like domain-containing protein [Cadophora sp. MPI-SDFR-AT-0126]|nr:kinase-like domain-containing protein [Leotiomycetes sp. MPI-SDFR-AT-0126]